MPELNIDVSDVYYCGDRWNGPDIDVRFGRKTNTLTDIDKVSFLDYNDDVTKNVYLIKNCKPPFITCFTGVGIISDLLNKETLLLWTDDIENWANQTVNYSFEKHY